MNGRRRGHAVTEPSDISDGDCLRRHLDTRLPNVDNVGAEQRRCGNTDHRQRVSSGRRTKPDQYNGHEQGRGRVRCEVHVDED